MAFLASTYTCTYVNIHRANAWLREKEFLFGLTCKEQSYSVKFFPERLIKVRAVSLGDTLYYHTSSRKNGGATSGSINAKRIGTLSASGRVVGTAGGSIADVISSNILPTKHWGCCRRQHDCQKLWRSFCKQQSCYCWSWQHT